MSSVPVMTVRASGLFSTTHLFSFRGGIIGRLAVPFLRIRGGLEDNLGHTFELRPKGLAPATFEMLHQGKAVGRSKIGGRPGFFAEFIYEENRYALVKRPGRRFDLLDQSGNPRAAFLLSGYLRQSVTIDGVKEMAFPLLGFIYFVIQAYYRRYFSIAIFSKIFK
jgi:hypothetical protein